MTGVSYTTELDKKKNLREENELSRKTNVMRWNELMMIINMHNVNESEWGDSYCVTPPSCYT